MNNTDGKEYDNNVVEHMDNKPIDIVDIHKAIKRFDKATTFKAVMNFGQFTISGITVYTNPNKQP